MRTGVAIVFGLGAAIGTAQVKLAVVANAKRIGVATITQKLRPDGSKQIMLSLEMGEGANKATFRSESIYSASGSPIRKFQETIAPTQKFRRARIADFDSKGARVVEDLNGKRTTHSFPLDSKQNRDDLSEFWFLRDKPKKGQSSKGFSFNMESLSWELIETTYQGETEIVVGGKKVRAHKTTSTRGTAFFDSGGNPLRLEVNGGVMERIPS